MNRATVLLLLRDLLKVGGGALVGSGQLTQGDLEAIIGGALALAGVIWTQVQKRREAQGLTAPPPQAPTPPPAQYDPAIDNLPGPRGPLP